MDNSDESNKHKFRKKIGRRRRFKHVKRHRFPNKLNASSDVTTSDAVDSESSTQPASSRSGTYGVSDFSTDFSEQATSGCSQHISYDNGTPRESEVSCVADQSTSAVSLPDTQQAKLCNRNEMVEESNVGCHNTPVVSLLDHEYAKIEPSSPKGKNLEIPEIPLAPVVDHTKLLLQVRDKLLLCLPPFWIPVVDKTKVYVMLLSRQDKKAVQRTISCTLSGDFDLSVHCHSMSVEPFLKNISDQVSLSASTVGEYCDRIVELVGKVRLMEICAGIDNLMYQDAWKSLDTGEVDNNPYQECRYTTTCRSYLCLRLVNSGKWKCKECVKLTPFVRRRYEQYKKEYVHQNTKNQYLSENQKLEKLRKQRDMIESQRKKLAYNQQRMQFLLAKEGVTMDPEISEDLHELLRNGNLTPSQSMFLQQQIKASQKRNMSGMRWHPSLIRIALAIYLNSRSTYELIRDSGVIKLPSSRTLFDYSHANVAKEGIDEVVLKSIAEKVDKCDGKHHKYHILMADEMYTSKNLVFRKSTGDLTGFMKLNELDKEIKLLENFLDDSNKAYHYEQSTKILTYLVKGVCTSLKEVIATYAVNTFTTKQMYHWTWDVIGTLERSGVSVISFTGDGSPTNRSFFKMHTAVEDKENLMEDLPGSVLYATVNKAAPDRLLYFFSDVPHLLKTIRNCFYNSRRNKLKGKRRLKLNGDYIVWDTIIDLYNEKKGKMLRKSYKLNVQNVFPDNYSCMRVPLAAQVMSRTVAADIEQQMWSGTTETVKFIRLVNDWFDCLNGSHSYQGRRKNNERLDPYRKVSDERFTFLIDFLKYLHEWKAQAEKPNEGPDETMLSEQSQLNKTQTEDDPPLAPVEDIDEEDITPAAQKQLSHQTLLGIEMTTKAFISCTRFLIKEECPYINARVFCQDALEQHFSKLRGGFGGSTNPNVGQCIQKNRAIHIQGQLGIKRKGNTECAGEKFEITEEPLPKRKCVFTLNLEPK